MRACGCNGKVLTVSPRQAERIVWRLPREVRQAVQDACVAWLTEEHPEVTIKSGFTAEHAYDPFERTMVGTELYAVERTACPFATADGCLLGDAPSQLPVGTGLAGPPYGWLPTLLLKFLNAPVLRELVRTRWVADAKVMVLSIPANFPEPRWSTNQPYVSRPAQLVTVSQPKKEVTDDGSIPEDLQPRTH